jgi:hypothetical protein
MRYARIFCGWSERLKPNESKRAFMRSAGLRFVAMLTSALDQKRERAVALGTSTPRAFAVLRLITMPMRVGLGRIIATA